MSEAAEWFWTAITVACLMWYTVMTVLVTVRGVIDIRGMLSRLRQGDSLISEEDQNPPRG
jgi:hypothetical protein